MLVSAFVDEKYPQGDDRLLISSIYHVEIPFSRTPEECGYLVMSAETVFNVYHCLKNACCVTKKALTVAGDGIPSPLNLMAHIGTPFEDIASSYQAETDALAVNGGIINGRTAALSRSLPTFWRLSDLISSIPMNAYAVLAALRFARCILSRICSSRIIKTGDTVTISTSEFITV